MKQYKYLPVHDILRVSKKQSHLETVKAYQNTLNQEASQGWNYAGTERLFSEYNPGCFNELLLNIPIIRNFVRGAEVVETKLIVFEKDPDSVAIFPSAKTASPTKVETLLSVESQTPQPIEKLVQENSISNEESFTTPTNQTEPKSLLQNPDLLKKVGIGIGIFLLLILSYKFMSHFLERNSSSGGRYSGSKIGIVNDKSGIRFRSGPGMQYSKIGFFDYGTTFKVLDTNGPEDYQNNASGRWYKVEYDGQVGWVFGAFVGLE